MRMRRTGSWEALCTEHRGQRALTRSCLRWLGVATVSLAIVFSAGCLSALDGVMASSRQNAGRGVSPGRLTLSQEEGQMDRCLHVRGTSFDPDAGPVGKPPGHGAQAVVAPEKEGTGRSHSSTHGPTS
jgi:hypothetical protein